MINSGLSDFRKDRGPAVPVPPRRGEGSTGVLAFKL